MAGIERSGLFEYFLSEAEDHINTLNKGFMEMEETLPDDDAFIDDLFRAAHTLKGAAALVKLTATSSIAHRMEDILEELKDKKIKASKQITELLSYMLDAIKGLIRDISENRGERSEVEQEVLLKVKEVLAKERETVSDFPEARVAPLAEKPFGRRKEDFEFFSGNFVKVDLRKAEEMLNLIAEITIKENYLLKRTKETGELADEIFFSGRRLVKEVNAFAERYDYSLPGNVKYIDPLLSEFGELEFDRYDDLNLFSRKLQETTNDITEALKELSVFFDSFGADVKKMGSMIKLLRSDISEIRMIDIGRLFQRFVEPVKDMARQYGKKVELLISGGDTKIDKIIFERLFDPLMHIVRNTISHGIEKPGERLQEGKKEEGLVFLSARRAGNTIVIEVNDNGRGIDTDRLFEEAVEQDLLMPHDKPTKEELLSLIFVPGFTTAEDADMSSGRGMGLSAARKQVSSINGWIEVDTDVGWNTTFRIKVPSSLAITNVTVFSSGNMEFAMTSNIVNEVILLDIPYEKGVAPDMINYRGRDIHVRDFSEVFGIAGKVDTLNRYVVICNISNKKAGLIVDSIIGQEETIIKPLNRFLDGLDIYSGTTMSGDGKVRFVINPFKILEDQIQPVAAIPLDTQSYAGRRVLIVDDSLSVRKYVSTFLEAKGFKVYSASNGVAALNILDETSVDIIITDLEMPLMHGYELISRIKSSESLKDIPIIVLTSRSAGKHREKALQSGANAYLVKPFDESALSDILKKHLPAIELA